MNLWLPVMIFVLWSWLYDVPHLDGSTQSAKLSGLSHTSVHNTTGKAHKRQASLKLYANAVYKHCTLPSKPCILKIPVELHFLIEKLQLLWLQVSRCFLLATTKGWGKHKYNYPFFSKLQYVLTWTSQRNLCLHIKVVIVVDRVESMFSSGACSMSFTVICICSARASPCDLHMFLGGDVAENLLSRRIPEQAYHLSVLKW